MLVFKKLGKNTEGVRDALKTIVSQNVVIYFIKTYPSVFSVRWF